MRSYSKLSATPGPDPCSARGPGRPAPEGGGAPAASELARVVERNIQALLERRLAEDRNRSFQLRLADRITRFTGSMHFVYLHLALFGAWLAINLGWLPLPAFDPTFVILAMFASVEAIFLSTFVLISQNRMSELADRRTDLDLQISLLAEHEVTRLITLVSAITERLGLEQALDPELRELKRDVRPEKVLDSIEAIHREGQGGPDAPAS